MSKFFIINTNILLDYPETNNINELEEKYRSDNFITFSYLLGKVALFMKIILVILI